MIFSFPGVLSLSSIACIVEICLPLGATRCRLGWLVLNSEASLPPVSILCEEFDCVPAAGATACPEKENALSLLSCSVICKARGYPLVGSVGVLRLITCESEVVSPIIFWYLILKWMFRWWRHTGSGFGIAILCSGSCSGLEPKGRVDVPLGCGSLRAELCGSVQWSVAYTLFA